MKELDYLGGILVGKILNKIDDKKIIDLKVSLVTGFLYSNLINLYCAIDFADGYSPVAISVQQKKPIKYTRDDVEKYCEKLCLKITEDLMNLENFEPAHNGNIKHKTDSDRLLALIKARYENSKRP